MKVSIVLGLANQRYTAEIGSTIDAQVSLLNSCAEMWITIESGRPELIGSKRSINPPIRQAATQAMSIVERGTRPVRRQPKRLIHKSRDVDEVDIDLNPRIGFAWRRRGRQTAVPTPGQNSKQYLTGALNAHTGRVVHFNGQHKDTALFLALCAKPVVGPDGFVESLK